MTWEKIREWISLPGLIVSCIAVIIGIIGYFGFSVNTPSEKFESHVIQERTWHDSTKLTLKEVDSETHNNTQMLESILRGECLENKKENLIRQGLLAKCKELGIER